MRWSGRSLGYDADSERGTYLAARGRWAGLPPEPVWWTWFGREYTPLVVAHLPDDQGERIGEGLFHRRAEAPADLDELVAALPPLGGSGVTRWFGRHQPVARQPWLPARLLPVVDSSDPRLFNPPLTPAQERPATFR